MGRGYSGGTSKFITEAEFNGSKVWCFCLENRYYHIKRNFGKDVCCINRDMTVKRLNAYPWLQAENLHAIFGPMTPKTDRITPSNVPIVLDPL